MSITMFNNFGVCFAPQFNSENYQFWAIKIRTYLKQ